jgi:hypothetical protein
MFVYYSMSVERLPDQYQAQKLQDEITRTRSAVEGFNWPTAISDHPGDIRRVKEPVAKGGSNTIEPVNYQTSKKGWDVPVVRPTVLRTDPELLAAVSVRATGGTGQIPIIDEQLRKERELKRQAEQEQKEREQAKLREKEQEDEEKAGQRNQFRFDGERGRGPGSTDYEEDPDHPKRRPIESMTQPPGAVVEGDEKIVMASWAVVVAKVPIREQLKLYRAAFEQSRTGFDPSEDFPRYAGFQIQRAEVLPGKDLQWVKVNVYDGTGSGKSHGTAFSRNSLDELKKVIANAWADEAQEVVAEQYLDQALLFPLPPLLHRDWGSEATHPDIPLAINAPPEEDELETAASEPVKKPDDPKSTDELDEFRSTDTEVVGDYGRSQAFAGARPGMGMPFGRGGRGDMDFMFRRGGGRGFPGGRGGDFGYERGMGRGFQERGGMAYSSSIPTNRTSLPKSVNDWLLRFIDFDVQPGKKYKYRVQLALDDPNQGSHLMEPERDLDPKVLNRLRESAKDRPGKRPVDVRLTEWSAPSPTVGIPLSGSVRLASAKPLTGNLFNEEPLATLLVEAFATDEEGNAIFAAKEKPLLRGFVANMVEDTKYLVSDGRSIDELEKFKFVTGMTVVDIRGGEKLPLTNDIQTPSRVLLMDPSGELVIRSELDDAKSVQLHRDIFADPKRRTGEMEEDRMRGRGGRGGFEFDR